MNFLVLFQGLMMIPYRGLWNASLTAPSSQIPRAIHFGNSRSPEIWYLSPQLSNITNDLPPYFAAQKCPQEESWGYHGTIFWLTSCNSLLSTVTVLLFCLIHFTLFYSSFQEDIKSGSIYAIMTGNRGPIIVTCHKHKLGHISFLTKYLIKYLLYLD